MSADLTDLTPVPTPTTDMARARDDLRDHGYCLIEGALDAERTQLLRRRILEIAAQEIDDGIDYVYDDGANQRVWNLLRKGDEFIELVTDPTVWLLMDHL